ncbi:hypothetical protein Tco_0165579, partial [Tanacetum coccineum]
PIDAINHMMSFLTAVVTSRYPTTNNQHGETTDCYGKVTVQPVQGRQTTYAAGTTRKYTPGASGSNTGKQRTIQDFLTFKPFRLSSPTMLLIKLDDLDAYDSDCDELNSAKIALMANLSRNEDTQLYGAILPVALTNEDIRNSESYKEYYAIASGTIPPKTKGSKKKANTDTITKQKPPTAPKEKKSGKGKLKTTELETI